MISNSLNALQLAFLLWLLSSLDTIVAFAPPAVLMKPIPLLSSASGNILFLSASRSSEASEGLAVLNNTAFSLLSKEAKYVRAIRACSTSAGVQAVLDRTNDPNHMSPNIAAAAMRTMIKFDRNSETTSKALPLLIKVAGSGVVACHKNEFQNMNMTLYAMQDVLYSLSLLRKEGMVPLANIICDVLAADLPSVLDKLEPRRLVEIMEAAHTFSLESHPTLFDTIAKRLSKSDAVGKLAAPKLCEGLMALASYPDALVRFLRRLRKQSVRRELSAYHVTMAIRAAGKLRKMDDDDFAEDVQVMAYTLVNRELSRPILGNTTTLVTQLSINQAATVLYAISKFEWDELTIIEDLCHVIGESQEAAPIDVALILQSFSKLEVDSRDLVLQLGSQLTVWLEDGRPIELRHMNVILTSVLSLYRDEPDVLNLYENALKQLLRREAYESLLNDASQSDIARYVWFLSEAGTERDADIGRMLGNKLLSIASENLEPARFVMAVRYAVKMYARVDADVLQPYLEATKQTCTGDCLSRMSSLDLSFLVEALVIAKCTDEELFLRLAKTAAQPSMVDDFLPSSARRIMTSFTNIVPRIPSSELQDYQEQLFQLLGASLLSTQLKPFEAAEAAFSYAKAGYVYDMGVFDHVNDLVSQNLSNLSTRRVAKCLWACGKMYVWEPVEMGMQAPPYLKSARKYAKHLASRESELSAKDVAQCLWAMGRLGISDPSTLHVFATQANHVLQDCFACETSNIIWGLSKTRYDDEDVMISISRRMLDTDIHASPTEAACVLYALGNAGIREDEVFEHLTEIMMSQLEHVGAQAMSNVLWAHNMVGKLPPPKLLQSWASDKLGLTGFLPFNPDVEWDAESETESVVEVE